MDVGDQLTCRLYEGGKVTVTLDDRVYPDRSCGQYEAGWWVFDESTVRLSNGICCNPQVYFLSESGILYDSSGGGAFTQPCGIEPGLARRLKEMEDL